MPKRSGSGEAHVQAAIRADSGSQPGVVLYKNSSGQATYTKETGQTYTVPYGLAQPGGSDLIGWRSLTITPDMVGQKVAVFVAVEVKKKNDKTNKKRLEQQTMFIELVRRSGGLAGFARSAEEARKILGL